MGSQRTASRRVASSICLGLGLAATVGALIAMVVDQASGDSVAARVHELYAPYGRIPDPIVPWVFLYGVFGLGAVGWAVALSGAWRGSRWWSPGCPPPTGSGNERPDPGWENRTGPAGWG